MYQLLFILNFALLLPFWEQSNTPSIASEETLIVFTQASTDQYFIDNCLPQLKAYARTQQLPLKLKSATAGLPSTITSTPAIVYQNARGRQLYAGRYTSFSSIRNFIRTSRYLPPVAAANCQNDQFALQSGRTTIMAPVKITPLQGILPTKHQETHFQAQALQAMEQGFQQFCRQAQVCLAKSDRAFYIDLHPYQDAQGRCFLSMALFSQFSCIHPVYQSETGVLEGKNKQWPQLFAQAAQMMESEILRQIQHSTIGDALSPVAGNIPVKTWEELALPLPSAKNEDYHQKISNIKLPKNWKYKGPIAPDLPVLQFRFQQPLDRYAGELKELQGQLQLDLQNRLNQGHFEVNTHSLTMGMPDLDEKVLKKYLKADRYPKASFHFAQLEGPEALRAGQTTLVFLSGQFQLMKYTVPIQVDASLTPLLNEQGQLQLHVQAQFELRISQSFQLEGPAPANETMLFYMNFAMSPGELP